MECVEGEPKGCDVVCSRGHTLSEDSISERTMYTVTHAPKIRGIKLWYGDILVTMGCTAHFDHVRITAAWELPELQDPQIPPSFHRTLFNMPSSDYTTAIGGGLKLKGAGVDKKKKKKKSKPAAESSSTAVAKHSGDDAAPSPSRTPGRSLSPETAEQSLKEVGGRKKTEAEKRHDEMRRKRLEERMKREGVKTHKEKVEELNKYLSGLSEHHDMPKIGPG
jgi:protein FAM32A